MLVHVQVGVGTTICVTFPFTGNRELGPSAWENFAHVDSVVVGLPVFITHPPISVLSERVIKALFKTFVIVPSLIFISESTEPDTIALSPGVSDAQDLQVDVLEIFNPFETIGMVKENTLRAVTIMLIAMVVLLTVRTTN
mgnify:CR=1 FL=1